MTFCQLRMVVVGAVLALSSTVAWANQWGATPQEQEMCRAFIPRPPANASPEWGHLHHFCDCLRFRNRAMAFPRDSNEFRFNIRESVDGCTYVIIRATPRFPLYPLLLVERGSSHLLARNHAEAASDFAAAIEANRRFPRAYIELAKVQRAMNRQRDALETLTEGLRYNPGHSGLQAAYLDSGGARPFPEPVATQTAPDRPRSDPWPSRREVQAQRSDEPVAEGDASDSASSVDSGRSCRFCPPASIEERWRESFETDQ